MASSESTPDSRASSQPAPPPTTHSAAPLDRQPPWLYPTSPNALKLYPMSQWSTQEGYYAPGEQSYPDMFNFYPDSAGYYPAYQAHTPSSDYSLKLPHGSSPSSYDSPGLHHHPGPSPLQQPPLQQPTLPPLSMSALKRTRGTSAKPSPSSPRKRRRTLEGNQSEESDTDSEGPDTAPAPKTLAGNLPPRLPGACTHCKKLKMRCDFPPTENTCKRCKQGGHACVVEGRKPRTAPNKREYLLAQIKQKDAIIESLLKQLHNPYQATPMSISSYQMATSPSDQNNKNILAWLDRLQESVRSGGDISSSKTFKPEPKADQEEWPERGHDDGVRSPGLPDDSVPMGLIATLSLANPRPRAVDDENDVGVANATYFMPGPAQDLGVRANILERQSPPDIIKHGLVTNEDVDKLFDIFYQRVNPFLSLLDPVLHTPSSTFHRCPFLFTVVCAISSRYLPEKAEIYPIAMHFAKHAASTALVDGWKSVELCQAYILMSVYAVPAKRWEEDRSWIYAGLAIRIATDLNLHQVPTTRPQTENQEREHLNRARVWMICYNLDRSTATQFGKPSTIKEDYLVRSSDDWYKRSRFNHPFDLHLCAYTSLLRIVSAFHDEIFSDATSPSGLNKNVNFRQVTVEHDAKLTQCHQEWARRFEEESDPHDPSSVFRCSLLPFLVSYSRLVMYSFGFQQAYQPGLPLNDSFFFSKCLESAISVVQCMIDDLAPSGYMRFSPDKNFVFAGFASAFLLKLLRPEFSQLLSKEQEVSIFNLINALISTLGSPSIAIDERHTPKLYARFLAGLLMRHRRDGSSGGRLHARPPPTNHSQGGPGHLQPHSHMSTHQSTFQISQPQGGSQHTQEAPGYSHSVFSVTPEPVYHTEPALAHAPHPFEFSSPVSDAESFSWEHTLPKQTGMEDMHSTMQPLKSPTFWDNMMMPGSVDLIPFHRGFHSYAMA